VGPTLNDIARETGTSISTVSRVLAGGAGAQRISATTREKVLEAASRLGYRPNLVARSLRTRKSNTVALLVSDIANPWFGQIAGLIDQSLRRHGYSLMVCNSGEDPEREQEYLRLLPAKGIDGLIVVPLVRSKRALAEVLPPTLPVVVLDRPIPGLPACVWSDPEQMAGILCDALERASVRTVAIVAGPQHVITHKKRREIVAERFKVVAEHEGPAQRETGRQAYIRFGDLRVDAIVCTNNFLGQGVIDGIGEVQRPPVIGCFDEIPMMHLLPIPIVCSVQDMEKLAEGSVEQLLPQLAGEHGQRRTIAYPARAVANARFQSLVLEG
jgi:LacI family transcriptional regulator